MESPYEVLQVDPGADAETVERAYRRRVKESHPDSGGSSEEFKRVQAAYEAVVSGEADPPDTAGVSPEESEPRRTAPTTDREAGTRASGVGPSASGRDPAAGPDRPEQSRVEYLDYEVLDDHGWSLADDGLFERAADADLDPDVYGRFLADSDELLLNAAEAQGYGWPFACRGGACANCAVYLAEGEVETTVDHVLSEEMHDAGFRLSCICKPLSERLRVVYNVKHLPGLDEFRLPATRFERAHGD